MSGIFKYLSLFLFAFFFVCTQVWSQGTAQISGTVSDQSGAVLPGVDVTVTDTETGIARTTITNETGAFVLPNLPVGPYRLDASLPGFRTFTQTGIVLQVNASPVINPVLEVGQVTEQVEVQANVAMVETRSTTVGAVIENQRILELPLNGRNVTDLIALSGAAVPLGNNNIGGRAFGGSYRFQIAGGLGYGTTYRLDGANYVNYQTLGTLPLPFPDALQEFKVDTSGVSIDSAKGSTVGAVTKSGTNEFHGNLFEFVRNDLFNATQYFAAVDPVTGDKTHSSLKRNQFGGTIGGPIAQDKLFFFGGFQYTTLRQDPATQQAFLPTPAMLNDGDWRTFASAGCNAGRALSLPAPFQDNQIDTSLYSPAGLGLAQRILGNIPVQPDPCGLVTFSRPSPSNDWQPIVRVDYQYSDKQTIFGRWNAHHHHAPTSYSLRPDNILTSTSAGSDNLAQGYVLGDTYLFSPNTVNAFRLSLTRVQNQINGVETPFNACDVGINVYCGYVPERIVLIGRNGAPSVGTSMGSSDAAGSQNHQIDEDLSLVRGSHQFAIGGSLRFTQSHIHDNFLDAPRITITGSTGSGVSDLMIGRLNSLVAAGPYYVSMVQWGMALYVGDTWKVSPRVTLTGGLRWEPYLPHRMMEGKGVSAFDINRYNAGIHSTVYPNAPAGWYYTGDPGVPGEAGMNKQWKQFAPRVGLAWDVAGDGKTSVRAAYSYSYTAVGAQWRDDPSQTPPWGNAVNVTNTDLDNPWATFPGGNPFPLQTGTAGQFLPYSDYQSLQYDLKAPAMASWNLAIQRQIGTDWLVSASYLGSITTHVWIQDALNPAELLTCSSGVVTDCNSLSNTRERRRFTLQNPTGAQMGNVALLESTANMNYHGMLLSANKRLSQNFSIQANYTWSHCIGDNVDLTSSGPDAGEVFLKPGDRGYDRGDCAGDRRHIWNSTVLFRTPTFANDNVRRVLSDWSLSGIYRWSSGEPLNILAGRDYALNGSVRLIRGNTDQRANQVVADPYGDRTGGPLSNWLDRPAFAAPAWGTLGNFRRNSVVAPAEWSFDVALSRQFQIREGQRVEVRAEAFNLTNSFRPDPGSINTTAGNGRFGQIRGALDPRIMQFALKYIF